MWLKAVKLSNFSFVFFQLNLMGVGPRGQSVLHWLVFFLGLSQRLYSVYLRSDFGEVSVGTASFFLDEINSLLLLLYLMFRRNSIEEFITRLMPKLSKSQMKRVQVADFILFSIQLYPLIERFALFFRTNHPYSCSEYGKFEGRSIASIILANVICINSNIINYTTDIICGFYLLIFIVFHFVKVQYMDEISSSDRWREKVLLASSNLLNLNSEFERCFSVILFFKVIHDFLIVMITVFAVFHFTQMSNSFWLIYVAFAFLRRMGVTFGLFSVIGSLQEKIEDECSRIRHQICCRGFWSKSITDDKTLADIFYSAFTQRVTIWKTIDVSRSSLVTLASSYFVFPVLFWQLNNGALGQLRSIPMANQTSN